jgi:hypothetical protein
MDALIENSKDDWRASRCGHNFPPAECPYRFCGYRDALSRIADLEETKQIWETLYLDPLFEDGGIVPAGTMMTMPAPCCHLIPEEMAEKIRALAPKGGTVNVRIDAKP